MFREKVWQKNCAEHVRNHAGQIVSWGKGIWGLDRTGTPKALPVYIGNTRNLVKYSKYDNFVEKTQEQFQVQHFRCITLADGTVDKTPLSEQNIDRQEKRLRREYQEKYGLRWRKQKADEDLSNDRSLEESKIQQPVQNPRYEEEKENPSLTNKKREEKKLNKDKDGSYGSAMVSSDEDNIEWMIALKMQKPKRREVERVEKVKRARNLKFSLHNQISVS